MQMPSDGVRIAAPTNKAVHVLQSKLDSDYSRNCNTIHKLLHAEDSYSASGNLEMKFSIDPIEWLPVKLLVIDESSMISREIFGWLLMHLPAAVKILFIGDSSQLPPVKEDDSSAFTHRHQHSYNLTVMKRTSDATLTFMYSLFRGWQRCNANLSKVIRASKYSNVVCDRPVFERNIRDHIHENGSYILAYSNEQVATYNRLARSVLFPDSSQLWCDGERGVFSEMMQIGKERFYTSEEFVAKHVDIEYNLISPPKFHEVFANYAHGTYPMELLATQYIIRISHDASIYIIHENSTREFAEYEIAVRQHLLTYIEQYRDVLGKRVVSGLWRAFHDWRKENNAPVGYAYAVTVHRAQGSGFNRVFIDARNIELCTRRDAAYMKKCMYTAVTRAVNHLLIYW